MLPVAGGVLMGLAAGLVLLLTGRLPGVSGLLASVLGADRRDTGWRLAFVLGLVAGGCLLSIAYAPAIPDETAPWTRMVLAGALVGIGAQFAGGCTSGHGLLGVGRLSWRSMVATMVFMAAGMVTVTVVRHWLGGVS